MLEAAAAIGAWWGVLAVAGVGFVPVVERVVPADFVDRGRAFAKPLAVVFTCYVAWLLSCVGVPHRVALGVAIVVFFAASGAAWLRREPLPWIHDWIVSEAVFVVVAIAVALVRSLQPDIFGAEKYMDFAFFNVLIRTRHLPPVDPWMAGVPINYYYFGYLLFADLARIAHAAPAIAYNLSLATIGGIVASVASSIGRLTAGRFGALLAPLAVVGLGNLDAVREFVSEKRTIDTFDTWAPTRVVPHTINEFPFFSLMHGDLHPHLTALVIVLPLIGLALAVARRFSSEAPPDTGALGLGAASVALLLGALALTNPWDVPVYLTLLGLLAATSIWDDAHATRSAVRIAALLTVAVVALVVLSLPFTLFFKAQGHGIGQVHERTTIGDFLLVFGVLAPPAMARLFLEARRDLPGEPVLRDLLVATFVFAALILYLASQSLVLIAATMSVLLGLSALIGSGARTSDLPLALATTALVAIAAGELVFLRDPYGEELHRMNTIFKLYFQAWILLALALPGILRALHDRARGVLKPISIGIAALAVALSLAYPYAAIVQRARHAGISSLDGTLYLDRDHGDDAAAIRWLAEQTPDLPVVLEATGDPYSYFARVSTNTGLPTVLGWGNHEGVWRGADPRIAQRTRDVETLYSATDATAIVPLLARYRIRYVFVGELERQRFDAMALAKFAARTDLFESVYRAGTTEVFAVRATTAIE